MSTAPLKLPSDYIYVHVWLILTTVVLFAFFVSFDQRYIQVMLKTDSSYLSGASILIFFGASIHALSHLISNSRAITAAEMFLKDGRAGPRPLKSNLFSAYLSELDTPASQSAKLRDPEAKSSVIEIYADKLRAPVELGWFIVELLIRLGLIGTIVGFIMILSSLVGGPLPAASEIQTLLVTMGGGMGTALYTTLAGLVAATLLAAQYIILGRSVEHLLGALIRIGERKP